jgi:hypothetical protein
MVVSLTICISAAVATIMMMQEAIQASLLSLSQHTPIVFGFIQKQVEEPLGNDL